MAIFGAKTTSDTEHQENLTGFNVNPKNLKSEVWLWWMIPDKVIARQSLNNNWDSYKNRIIALRVSKQKLAELVEDKNSKNPTPESDSYELDSRNRVLCEMCFHSIKVGDLAFMPDGTPQHLRTCKA